MNSEKLPLLSTERSEGSERESLFGKVLNMIAEGFNLKKAALEGMTLFGTKLSPEGKQLFNEGGDIKLSIGKKMADAWGFSEEPDFMARLKKVEISKAYYDRIKIDDTKIRKFPRDRVENWVDPEVLSQATPILQFPVREEQSKRAA